MARKTIIVGETSYFADEIKATGIRSSHNSFAPDTLQFSIPRSIAAAKLFADGQTIQLLDGTTRAFYGVIRATPVSGTPASERHVVNASGGWWGLERVTFEQLAKRDVNGVQTDVLISSVILGRTGAGDELMKCGEVIEELIAFAAGKGVLISAGTVTQGPYFPEEEGLDLTCADGIIRVCRWMPDMVSGFDHAIGKLNVTTTPTSTVTISLASSAYRVDLVDPAPRTDLIVPGVRVDYQIVTTVFGSPRLSLVRETAGNPDAAGGVKHTMAIAGQNLSGVQQLQRIKVAALHPSLAEWWIDHCPDLADPRISNLVITNLAGGVVLYGTNELLEGSIQEWMLAGVEGAKYSLHAGESTFNCLATYDLTIAGKVIHVEERQYSAKVTTTDATTRTYSRRSDSLTGGEYVPLGLAASLYSAGSKTWWDGQITITGPECQLGIIPGMAVNVTGGRAEWASMAARIINVEHDYDAGKTTIRVGPPRQMTLGDLRDQLKRNRQRHVPTSTGLRLNPDFDAGNGPNIDLGSHHPRKFGSAGMALLGVEAYIVTDVRIDLTTDKLQVNRRKGYVVWSEADPGWTNVTNWDVTNCDEY